MIEAIIPIIVYKNEMRETMVSQDDFLAGRRYWSRTRDVRPSDKQIKRMFAIGYKNGYSKEDIKSVMKKKCDWGFFSIGLMYDAIQNFEAHPKHKSLYVWDRGKYVSKKKAGASR